MKFLLSAATTLTALCVLATSPVNAGVSISVGEPGYYGHIDIGNYPAPRLIYREPVIVRPVTTWYPPVYLRVPPGHAKKWYKHCSEYNACGRPVYFVDDGWYQDVYVPRYREHHPHHVYAPGGPPPVVYKPQYYEYRKYEHKPPKKVYIREEYYEDGRRHGNDHHGKDRHQN